MEDRVARRRWVASSGPVFAVVIAVLAMMPAVAAAQSAASNEVTFTKDVAPILYDACVVCHRAGEMGPMALTTYGEVRPWARSIKERVAARVMPPWHIDKNIGIQEFKDDRSLTDEQIATIVTWVDTGAPMGDPADLPQMPEFPNWSEWQIGEPDLVVRYPDYLVPAEGPDIFGSLYAPFDLEEDRYISAIQTRPVDRSSRRVVHHALSYAVDQDYDDLTNDGTQDQGVFLVEYASGKGAEQYPEDSGKLLPADKKARVSYHLHSIGEDVQAGIELGIVFHPKGTVPEHVRWSKQLARHNTDLDIPAGMVVRQDGYERLNMAARLTAFQPHMHILGKVSVFGVDLSDHADHERGRQLRELRLQLAPRLQLRGRRGAVGARGHDPAHHQLARQHGKPTGSTRIRRTGPGTAAARSTRWASRGSAGTT